MQGMQVFSRYRQWSKACRAVCAFNRLQNSNSCNTFELACYSLSVRGQLLNSHEHGGVVVVQPNFIFKHAEDGEVKAVHDGVALPSCFLRVQDVDLGKLGRLALSRPHTSHTVMDHAVDTELLHTCIYSPEYCIFP